MEELIFKPKFFIFSPLFPLLLHKKPLNLRPQFFFADIQLHFCFGVLLTIILFFFSFVCLAFKMVIDLLSIIFRKSLFYPIVFVLDVQVCCLQPSLNIFKAKTFLSWLLVRSVGNLVK